MSLCLILASAAMGIVAAPSFGATPLFSVSQTKVSGELVSVTIVTQPHYRCSLTLRRGSRIARRVVTATFRGTATVTVSSVGSTGKVTVAGNCVPGDYQPPVANQEGTNGPTFRDVVAVQDGAGASLADAEGAIAWAIARQGSTEYNWWCLKFVANAYGAAAAGFQNPVAMVSTFGLNGRGTAPSAAPRGALMIFSAATDNGFNGHVGISLGDGRMVDAETTVAIRTVQGTPYWGARYLGWISPPAQWPGRPSSQAPTPAP